jgi:hypothetical protein
MGSLLEKRKGENPDMNDLIYVGVVIAFFVVSGLYVQFCGKL